MDNTIKKESEVTKVTNLGDNDCIRATLENGQSVSIKKSDLMPIIKDEIGKLLGNADALSTFTNVLVNNGQTLGKATIENLASVVSGMQVFPNTLTHQDVNDLTKTGIYCYNDGGLGVPSHAPSGMEIFVLEVLNTGTSGYGANMIIQKAYNYDMNIAVRIKFIDTWRDWKFI